MIIAKAPVRIPLGGGGTDLPEFYNEYGEGRLSTCSINKYVYCLVRENFESGIRFTGYHRKETVAHTDQLENPLVKAVLRYLNIDGGVEIVAMSDVRSSCGLGTSSSFTVALLKALHVFNGREITPSKLAAEAYCIERDILRESGGFQDQYIAAFGGGLVLHKRVGSEIDVVSLNMTPQDWRNLFSHFLFFDTAVFRNSHEIQQKTVHKLKTDSSAKKYLAEIFEIGLEIEDCLNKKEFGKIGSLFARHWSSKLEYIGEAGNLFTGLMERGLAAGASGGKLMGAGGGGYLLVAVPDESIKPKVRKVFEMEGFSEVHFEYSGSGCEVIKD